MVLRTVILKLFSPISFTRHSNKNRMMVSISWWINAGFSVILKPDFLFDRRHTAINPNYRKKVILRTLRRCLLTAFALAAPGIILGIFRPLLFWWALPAAIPLVYLAARLYKCVFWVPVMAKIREVKLDVYDDSGEAATSARVTWDTADGESRTGYLTVSHWEGEADEESQKLFREQADEYAGKLVPIFYNAKNPEKFIGYIEDAE